MGNDSNDKKALIALMDLVLALADYVTTPPGHRSDAVERVRVEQRQVQSLRDGMRPRYTMEELLDESKRHLQMQEVMERRQDGATRLLRGIERLADGQAARTAVAATERRMRAWQGLADIRVNVVQQGSGESWAHQEPIEADDSRVTDGHKCCGGKPDCRCVRSVGG